MKKYVKMLPVMLYPYAYIPFLVMAFLVAKEDRNMEYIIEGGFVYGIIVHVLALFFAIYNAVATAKGKYDIKTAAKINMMTKLVHIPAYVLHFSLGCVALLMSIWGIGIIMFVIIIDVLTIFFSGLSALGISVLLYKRKILSKRSSIWGGIFSFIFCIDVVVAVFYFVKAKSACSGKLG